MARGARTLLRAHEVYRVRLRYAKRGKLRFASHRDVARTFERALRRAGVPMAYSQGYSPRPKVSWVGAAPTGAASEAEYVEIQLVEYVDPRVVVAELDAALPEGIAVLEGVLAGPGGLAERIEASAWRIEIQGLGSEQLRQAARLLLAAPTLLVERVTKDGRRSLDVRAAIVSLDVEPGDIGPGEVGTVLPGSEQSSRCGILKAVVRQVSPAVRPDDVLSALDAVAGLPPSVLMKAIRTAQGRLDDDGDLVDPLAADRAFARTALAPDQGSPDGWAPGGWVQSDGSDRHDVAGDTG